MRLAGTKLAANHQYRGFGDQLYDLSGQRPSLDLNFSSTKSLVDATTGQNLVTFTRASSGTYVDSQGVIRTATTNVIWPSEDFGTNWSLAAATRVTDAGIAPNGTLTADRIESTGGGVFRSGVSVISGVPYTYSVYVKHVSGTGVLSSIGFERFGSVPLAGQVSFNVLTGTVVSNGAAVTASSIIPVGDGWYRVSVRATSTDTTTTIINYASASGNQFLLWGAQLEQSSTVGEYIPTTSTINSAPRFDHNPTTGESLGLLVEEQRTNLLLRSEELNEATSWAVSNASIASNAVVAPNGLQTADKLVEDTAASTGHFVRPTPSPALSAGQSYVYSVFAKAAERTFLQLILTGVGAGGANIIAGFDLNAGTAGTPIGGTSSISPYGNGWYRCSLSVTASTTASTLAQIRLSLNSSATPSSYTGDGTSGIYIWGAQLEAGAFPTSYIPTTTATATRSADVASITGSNFSSWYRQSEGTVYWEGSRATTTGFPDRFRFSDGTNANRWFSYWDAANNSSTFEVITGSASQAAIFGGAPTLNVSIKTAFGFAVNNVSAVYGGNIQGTDTSVSLPTISQVTLCAGLTGHIRRLTYFPIRLANEVLQRITQ